MSFTINTNTTSLQAQQYLRNSSDFQTKTISHVTSGLRIVSSGDDAAGLAIANGLRSDQAVLTQGIRNANDGLSQLQIVDGGINNISQLLDRARSLATQSASGTFTGDRSVLNSEFQSVVGEINRQAQSIGLDQNGAFAKNLSVFIGGGKTNNGISQISNGSESLDLSKSTVDARSLGLTGVVAAGQSGTDIGSSSATSLGNILKNASNVTATAGFTTFILRGPGFDSNGIKLTVNSSNLGGTSDLIGAVNGAIASAQSNGTAQGTALKNANITASINTDSNGKQQLAFSSSTSAFQVQAGDKLANALLGNFQQNASLTSTDTTGFTDTSTNHTLTFSIDGGSAFSVAGITSAVGTSKAQIVKDLNADSGFHGVATAVLAGNQIEIKSNTNGSTSAVAITTTALSTSLGLSGSATSADVSTGSDLSTSVVGNGPLQANANIIGTNNSATATISATASDLKLQVGSGVATTITLSNLGTQTKTEIASDINTQIAGAGALAGKISASVVNNKIVFTSADPSQSITVGTPAANSLNAALGFTGGTSSSTHTATTSDTIHLRFQGSGLTSPVDIDLAATTAGTTTSASILTDLQSKISTNSSLQAAGITLSSGTIGNALGFTSSKGEQFQVISTGDSQNVLGLGSFKSGSGPGVVDYTTLTAGSAYSTATAGATSNLEVSLNGLASSAHNISVSLNGVTTDATAATVQGGVAAGGNFNFSANGATGALKLLIDGTHAINVALGTASTTASATLATLNTALGAFGSASLDSTNHLVIKSTSTGGGASVEVLATSDAGTLTDAGLTTGVTNGTSASLTNVVNQINTAIAGDTALAKSGLQAINNGGSLQITSNTNTFFRLNSYGAGDLGFGNQGSTFTGNSQSAAPSTSQYVDSQGAQQSASLAYTDTLYGSDNQTIAVTGLDSAGAKHSIGLTLQNNTTTRAQTIDQAISQINSKLQQSNDPTLQSIVAVKENVNGAQKINFLSTLTNFQVSVGADGGGTGITSPSGSVANSTSLGTGQTASVDSQTNAAAAVTALSKSVSLLGSAQAVVGRGENQFNYAVNLAQSQLTNLAAAESRIRDADLASEAANLTKSQILVQAGVAALAQANSAPQQILSLLRG